MIGTGRGEMLSPIDLKLQGKFIVIIKPDIHVSTAEAYAGIKPAEPETPLRRIIDQPVSQWKARLLNDFEKTVFDRHPRIKEIKEALYQHSAWYASMSGSGSSVFGIFDHPVDLQNEFSAETYWSGELTV
jgi:4-diphosphocytidyl-2-C-methyl-D-erythritol kinase